LEAALAADLAWEAAAAADLAAAIFIVLEALRALDLVRRRVAII
jgi:hypothetical protein